MKNALPPLSLVLGSLALIAGCEDNLPKATEIERMRILGARLEVVGDEARTTPRPGEELRITFATVFPDLDQTTDEMQTLLIGCTAPDRFTGGIPVCQEFIDAAQNVDAGAALGMALKVTCSDIPGGRQTFRGVTVACIEGAPRIELPTPETFEAPEAMFIGIACERGEPFIDPEAETLFGCDDNDGESIALHGTYKVQQADEDANRNVFAGDLALITDEPENVELDVNWLPRSETLAEPDADPLSADECDGLAEGSDVLRVLDVGRHSFSLRYPAGAREEVDGQAEDVEITVHATSGEMERRFTVWTDSSEVEDGMLKAQVEWHPDRDDRPDGGKLVRFFVTLRDQRGGFDMSTYAVCIP